MKKDITSLISLIIVFCLFIFQLTLTFLVLKGKNIGTITSETEFYDIKFVDATIDLQTDSYMQLDNNDKSIKINIKNLNDFKTENSFTVDILNIGNKDITINNYQISNVSSIDIKNVDIKISLQKQTTIRPNEKKRIKISVKYNGKIEKNPFYSAKIKFISNKSLKK